MKGFICFPNLKSLNLNFNKITEEGLDILIPKEVKQLEQLILFMVHFEETLIFLEIVWFN